MALCFSQEEFNIACRHIGIEEPDIGPWNFAAHGATTHSFVHKGKSTCIVCLNDSKSVANGPDAEITIAAMLVHEATHIKQHLMETIGEKNPSREFEAYCMQTISMHLMLEYKRRLMEV